MNVVSIIIRDFKYIDRIGYIPPWGATWCFTSYDNDSIGWSTAIKIMEIDSDGIVYGKLTYVFYEDAPLYMLRKGAKIPLFDGDKVIGIAEILNDISDGEMYNIEDYV